MTWANSVWAKILRIVGPVAGAAVLLALAPALHAQCVGQWLPGGGVPGVSSSANASIMWDPDGPGPLAPALVVGGSFNLAGPTAASNIAYWDGTNWRPFGAGVDNVVTALAVMPNGDLVAGGAFANAGGRPRRTSPVGTGARGSRSERARTTWCERCW